MHCVCESVWVWSFTQMIFTHVLYLALFLLNRTSWRTSYISLCRAASFFLSLQRIPLYGSSVIYLTFQYGPFHILTHPSQFHICFHICIPVPISTNIDLHCTSKLLKKQIKWPMILKIYFQSSFFICIIWSVSVVSNSMAAQ